MTEKDKYIYVYSEIPKTLEPQNINTTLQAISFSILEPESQS